MMISNKDIRLLSLLWIIWLLKILFNSVFIMIMESVHNTGQRRDVGKKHFAFCQNNKVNTGTGMISYSKGLVLHVIR